VALQQAFCRRVVLVKSIGRKSGCAGWVGIDMVEKGDDQALGSALRRGVLGTPGLGGALRRAKRLAIRATFPGSARYWERRYARGNTSGAGSYGVVAEFKAATLNGLIRDLGVSSVLELGCGDGNQLSLAEYPRYVGLDISATAVGLCIDRFQADETKSFFHYDPRLFINNGALTAELSMSLDVVLHLVEDDVFSLYMRQLFACAERYVVLFTENANLPSTGPWVRYREVLSWIEGNLPDWQLKQRIDNPFKGDDSIADFYIFTNASSSR
jgi:SAM-dependent methyltransferase